MLFYLPVGKTYEFLSPVEIVAEQPPEAEMYNVPHKKPVYFPRFLLLKLKPVFAEILELTVSHSGKGGRRIGR